MRLLRFACYFAILATMWCGSVQALSLSNPTVISNRVEFSFASEKNQTITVQSSSSLKSDWQEIQSFSGTGAPITFSVPATGEAKLFRLVIVSEASAPTLLLEPLLLKAGEKVELQLAASGGVPPLSWSAIEPLPAGLSLSPDGVLSGTPTSEAAEHNEDGRFVTLIEVQDSARDPLSQQPAPRTAKAALDTLVRLSYVRNIRAARTNGPSLVQNCSLCHSADFKPNITGDATELINVLSGSGAECGTDRAYIAPPDASDSLIYEKVSKRAPCGERMPFRGEYLSEIQIERLARWIRELQPDDID